MHAASTDEHRAVALTLTAGHRHDSIAFPSVYAQARAAGQLHRLTADRAYDALAIRTQLQQDQVAYVIPGIRGRHHQPCYCPLLYRQRHKIENWFRKLQDFRRLATRYDKLAACFLALVHLASAFIYLRSFVNTP